MKASRWAVVAAVAGLLSIVGVRVGAQDRETLESKVTGVRGSVILEWTKKHLWDAQLMAAPPTLVAEYRTSAGRVSVDCLSPTPRGGMMGCIGIVPEGTPGNRSVRYALPSRLAGVPTGPVCLVFQMRDRRTLPLRRADASRSETARFRFESWEAAAAGQSLLGSAEARVARLRDSVQSLEARIRVQRDKAINQGGESESACRNMQAPSFSTSGGSTRPVAPPAEHARLASTVCVARVLMAELDVEGKSARDSLLSRLRSEYVTAPDFSILLGALQPDALNAFRTLRGAQLTRFVNDWRTYVSQALPYLKAREAARESPHFGSLTEMLSLQTGVQEAGKRVADAVIKGTPASSQDVAGFVGGSLEAYDVCLSDGMNQMQTSYEASRATARREPQLAGAAREELIRVCLIEVEALLRMQSELVALRERLASATADLSRAQGAAPSTSQDARQLNHAACVP